MFLVTIDFWIIHLTTNETFGVENGVFRVGVVGVLGGVADETFFITETYP